MPKQIPLQHFTMKEEIKQAALQTILTESQAVLGLQAYINDDFGKALDLIAECKGRLVISGMGKSAIIAQKLTATFNSTGTPSIFMHAGDAIHGDLGMVQEGDVVMIISKSGESPEIKVLLPLIRAFGNILIGMTGNLQSSLALGSNIVLNTTVPEEACPHNLAPTSSTTAQLVMGDALAICLMRMKGFGSEDFAKFHPGGALGKQLYLTVSDLFSKNEKPQVSGDAGLREVIIEISRKRLGAAAVTDTAQQLLGIVTDGDLRRMLEKTTDLNGIVARDIMTAPAKTIDAGALAIDALDLMRTHDINQLVVVNEDGSYSGIIHLHDLVREGLI
jgi:arabinose-5-phosphate isomerase